MMRAVKTSTVLFAAAALLLVAGCARVTAENLQKVQPGMSPPEVIAILGQPTKEDTSAPLNVVTLTVFEYQAGTSSVKIRFINGKLTSKEGEFK